MYAVESRNGAGDETYLGDELPLLLCIKRDSDAVAVQVWTNNLGGKYELGRAVCRSSGHGGSCLFR